MNHLILASGSPRRRELLSLYTTDFTVCVSDFDESAVTAPTPAQLVEQLAIGKCLAVAKQHPDAVVIGCDTVVDVDGTVFGKPHDAEDAKRMLRALSGKTHQVHTGVCIAKGDRAEHFVDSCKRPHTVPLMCVQYNVHSLCPAVNGVRSCCNPPLIWKGHFFRLPCLFGNKVDSLPGCCPVPFVLDLPR
mgnify:CR=1 FL=1